jgi:NAD(P)-dependent dehydrogenase (short-subunit alcohol dehydrogenase family)
MKNSKVALVTGANKGIGLGIARGLGALGMTVLVGARDRERGEAAASALRKEGADARWIAIDVTDARSIAAAASAIAEEHGKLDVLVNNAGIGRGPTPPSEESPAVAREIFDTNYFGVLAVTIAMMPLLRRAPAARIVNMSSTLGSLALASDPTTPIAQAVYPAYSSSKSALNAFTVRLANELRDTTIKVNSACPGYVATDLNGHQGVRTVEEGAAIAIKLATLDARGPTGGFYNDAGSVPW